MRQTLEEKDERIQSLEEENALLRSQLQRLTVAKRQRQPTPGTAETPRHRQTPPSTASGKQQRAEPRKRQGREKATQHYNGGDQEADRRVFSPGTKFVAELAQVMDIEVGHYAPLSFILDQHWDKLAPYYKEDDDDEVE
jgi:hypothetical protein